MSIFALFYCACSALFTIKSFMYILNTCTLVCVRVRACVRACVRLLGIIPLMLFVNRVLFVNSVLFIYIYYIKG